MAMCILVFLILLNLIPSSYTDTIPQFDVDLLEFQLNLEYLEAEFFLYGALGYGLDKIAPNLTGGGPTPLGTKKANLDPFTEDIVLQFAYQEVGHLRAIKSAVKGFPRPLLDLSAETFAKLVDQALGPLIPPFDPYNNSLNYLIASYMIPSVGVTGYVGTNANLQSPISKRLVAGLAGVESGQDALIRTLLYKKANEQVPPYGITVKKFTHRISSLRNSLARTGLGDEGIIVPIELGAEGKVTGNVLAGDPYSGAYGRTPEQILRIVYGNRDEQSPGGFYPKGGDGRIARSHLH